MAATLTYVFCLVRNAVRPSVRGVPAALPGAGPLRVLDVGPAGAGRQSDLWLIVASVPQRQYGEAEVALGLQDLDWVGRRALAHEGVVERFLKARAVVPMQLFTLFTSDDRAMDHVARDRRRISRVLARIDRSLEWGLRLTWDEQSARDAIDARHRPAAPRANTRNVTGSAYLARKRDLLDLNRVKLADARAAATRVFKAMGRAAADARRRTSTERAAPGSRLLLDVAFLVPAARAARFQAAVKAQARQLEGTGIALSLTGPWPPYNFI